MNKGQGSIGRTNKVDAVVVPPATVTGADNGLTLLGTIVELGGPLIKNTNVDSGFFLLQLGDITGLANGMRIDIDNTAQVILIGDTAGVGNSSILDIDDNLGSLTFVAGPNTNLSLDATTRLYQIGDVSGTLNGTKIDIKDLSQAIELDAGTSPARLTLVGNPGTESLTVDFAASPYFSLDPNAGNYFMGDLGGVVNQTTLTLSDSVSQAAISSLGFSMLFLDMVNGIFQLGASAGGTANLTYFQVDDNLQTISTNNSGNANGLLVDFSTGQPNVTLGNFGGSYLSILSAQESMFFQGTPSSRQLSIDAFNNLYEMGDISNVGNSTILSVDDALGKINLQASNGVGVNILPTNSPFAVAALQAFANNAAAVVGGLGVGDFYRLSVAGTSAVMVVE